MKRPKSSKRKHPSVRPDLTKLIRAVEDAMTGVVYTDDARIVNQTASKFYAPVEFVRVLVTEVEE